MQQVTYIPGGGTQVVYNPSVGQRPQGGQHSAGGMAMGTSPMMHQSSMGMGGGPQGGYMSHGGEPSMRDSVEGIPQIHVHTQPTAGGAIPVMQSPAGMQPQQAQPTTMPAHVVQYTMPSGQPGAPPVQGYPQTVPLQYSYPGNMVHAGPSYPQLATHVQDYRFGGSTPFVMDTPWHGGGEWEDDYEEHGGALLYPNIEVKHRRRTTPEQLRVLEHWFNINPRPDNSLREWLAGELGITKRNVQVWFQNRRAKIKNQEKAREAAALDAAKEAAKTNVDGEGVSTGGDRSEQLSQSAPGSDGTPSAPATTTPVGTTPVPPPYAMQQSTSSMSTPSIPERPSSSGGPKSTPLLLPTDAKFEMGRRVSIAGGDVAIVEQWAKKRQQELQSTPTFASHNSPIGQAAMARRNSQPYVYTHHDDLSSRATLSSPKVSPNGRMSSGLLVTAMRNNTIRRASMPGGPLLISTTAFTPPRVGNYVSAGTPTPSRQPHMARELSPITDQDVEIDPSLRPPFSQDGSYAGSESSFLSVPGPGPSPALQNHLNPGLPFQPNSPLPNPTFSFGAAPPPPPATDGFTSGQLPIDKSDPQAIFMALQRGRLGSIASVNSVATTVTEGTEGGSDLDWPPMIPPGFDPDTRRASAPADLLHNIGLLGISTPPGQNQTPGTNAAFNVRPSPLAPPKYAQTAIERPSTYGLLPSGPTPAGPMSAPVAGGGGLAGGPYLPATDSSPTNTTSAVPSEGPSPVGAHVQVNGASLMPPPPLPGQRQAYTFPDASGQGHQQFAFNADSHLPPSLPLLPEPTPEAYLFPAPTNDSSDNLGLDSSQFDLGFDFQDPNGQKTEFSFLADMNETGDSVNVTA